MVTPGSVLIGCARLAAWETAALLSLQRQLSQPSGAPWRDSFAWPSDLIFWIPGTTRITEPSAMSEFIFQLIRGRTRATTPTSTRGEEIFHHLAGGITAQIMDDGKRRDAILSRPAAGTWPDELDRLAWLCDRGHAKLHLVAFTCANIETQPCKAIQALNASASLRTCKACAVLPVQVGAR
jgi:hypothetical protein